MTLKKLQSHSIFPFFHNNCDLLVFSAVELLGGRWKASKLSAAKLSSVENSPVFWMNTFQVTTSLYWFQSSEKVYSDNASSFVIALTKEETFGSPTPSFSVMSPLCFFLHLQAQGWLIACTMLVSIFLSFKSLPYFTSGKNEVSRLGKKPVSDLSNCLEDEEHWRLSHLFIHFTPSK